MGALERLRRFVDWDLRARPISRAGALTFIIGMLPWLALVATDDRQGTNALSPSVIAAITFDVVWFSYVGWRAWLAFRRSSIRGDRLYDIKTKYALPPEYAETESATKARRRREKRS